MRRFSFRLQKILDLRRALRKNALTDVARALHGLSAEEACMHRLHGARLEAWRELQDGLGDETAGLEADLRRIGLIERALENGELRKQAAEATLQQARAGERLARREVDVYEHLHDRAEEEWRLEQRRHEERLMDEVAQSRHVRRESDR